jgi:hypothetical protein
MKINNKILNIPPYISTSWHNVDYLKIEEVEQKKTLIIGLVNGSTITIPSLNDATITEIFNCHANSLEDQLPQKQKIAPPLNPFNLGITPIQFSIEGFKNINSILEHNPNEMNSPNLPDEIISQISTIIQMLGINLNAFHIPEEQPDCNCPYCQIAKVLHGPSKTSKLPTHEQEEMITEEDLRFRDWDIKQASEKLFNVTHPFDNQERYQVFLGNPIGCTCGKSNCEHIRAVLLN